MIINEIRAALGRLRRARTFALLCVVIQAFGIAIAVSGGTFLRALFQPHQIRDVSRVVDLERVRPPDNLLSSGDVEYITRHQGDFEDLLPWSYSFEPLELTGRQVEWTVVEAVGGNYFEFVGHHAALGRGLVRDDDRPGASPVAVISDALWRRAFNSDSRVLGRTIRLGDGLVAIVGITSPAFRGIRRPNSSPTALWITLSAVRGLRPLVPEVDEQLGSLKLEGRLKAGVGLARAQAALTVMATQMDREAPIRSGPVREAYAARRTLLLRPADVLQVGDSDDIIGLPVWLLAISTVIAFCLIVCANLALLAIARANGRRHEGAIRMTLGASRARVVANYVWDGVLLSVLGASAGGLLGVVMFRGLLTAARQWPGFTVDFGLAQQGCFLLLLGVASVTCFLAVAFGPAVTLRRAEPARLLSMGANIGGGAHRAFLRALCVGQVAVSFALVSVALVCHEQVARADAHQSGVDLDRLAVVQPDFWIRAFRPSALPEWLLRRTSDDLLSRIRRLPGVESAAISTGLPVGRTATVHGWISAPDQLGEPEQGTRRRVAWLSISTPDVFRTLGVRLAYGRLFDSRDVEGASRVVVITRSDAVRLFGGEQKAVGRLLVLTRQQYGGEKHARTDTLTVVGVVDDCDAAQIGYRGYGVLFLPFAQNFHPAVVFIARTSDPRGVAAAMRRTLEAAQQVGVTFSGTGRAAAGAEHLVLRGTERMGTLFGLAALVFSMGGLGALLWMAVTERTHEIAVRMALGASPSVIARGVMLDGVAPTVGGALGGIGLHAIIGMALRPVFIQPISASTPVALMAVAIVVGSVAALTSYVPAAKAARSDPASALKDE